MQVKKGPIFVAELPPKTAPKRKPQIEYVLDKLQETPLKWAMVAEKVKSYEVSKLRKEYPDFEWATRLPDGVETPKLSSGNSDAAAPVYDLYCRYQTTEWYLEQQRLTREGHRPGRKPKREE